MNAPRTRASSVKRRPVHGLLLLDKPLGLSSNDALQKAKWLLRAEKAGHTGTLDPLATGVLPLCFGAATKFSQLHLEADKSYDAVAKLGQKTSTGDAEGDVIESRPLPWCAQGDAPIPSPELVRVQQQFTGPIQQVPPMYSALKRDGKALYEYAREGIEVERPARSIEIKQLQIDDVSEAMGYAAIRIRVRCSKGTYIRTLGEDIGEALGCGAHLVSLRRTQTGDFDQSQCISISQLEAMAEGDRSQTLLPVEALLAHHTRVTLAGENAARFLSGLRRRGDWANAPSVAVFGEAIAAEPAPLLGVAHVMAGELIPDRLLSPIEIQQILESKRAPSNAANEEVQEVL